MKLPKPLIDLWQRIIRITQELNNRTNGWLWDGGNHHRLSIMAYISSLIFIFGAYLSVSYWQLRQKQ